MLLEREEIGASFKKWPEEMKLITPSFTTNFYGHLDLNAVISGTSPAFMLRREHPTGKEYALYLKAISEYFELPGSLMNSALVESQFDPAREVSYSRFQGDSNFSFSSVSVDESMEDPGLSLT